ncbi:MAG: transketolase C-terminal domain-containing protein [Anaerolineaceae bacterium]
MSSVLDSLNSGLLAALRQDERVLLLGEDILDPYGGAFKVTRGCSTAYPDRVMTTPISEAGLGGVCAGLALRGMRPVLEIMFGDFITLLADQLINHISKFRWMYNDSVAVPLVIRTPMGGRRGYGPTHSQTLEKIYLGVPGLTVVAPLNFDLAESGDCAGGLLQRVILEGDSPVLFVENKLQYLLPMLEQKELTDFVIKVDYSSADRGNKYPIVTLTIKGAPAPTVTLTAYGYMAELARQAQLKLAYEDEIFTELVLPTQLSPFSLQPLLTSIEKTGKLLTIEEGTGTLGWGAEILAQAVEKKRNLTAVGRVSALDHPVPAAPALENNSLPQMDDIIAAVKKMV